MGYRERQFHKQQQKQQALGKAYTPEKRVNLPAPMGMDSKTPAGKVPLGTAVLLQDAIPQNKGLLIKKQPRLQCYASGTSGVGPLGLISYNGCGSTSAELWFLAQTDIYNAGELLGNDAYASTSAQSAPNMPSGTQPGSWVEFSKTIIYVNGQNAIKWNRASGWEQWSATASGGSANLFWGINSFKSRLYGWEQNDSQFWYGSTDQILGTFNSFDLSPVMDGNLFMMVNMTRDGGAGPDDYAAFISDAGEVAVYEGNDPGDANNWSLVGKYQIGVPIGRDAHCNYGAQSVVLCTDDFYFLPQDLQGKSGYTPAASPRTRDRANKQTTNGVYHPETGLIVFGDGSVISLKNGFEHATITYNSAPFENSKLTVSQQRPQLALYKKKLYGLIDPTIAAPITVRGIFPETSLIHNPAPETRAKILTSPVPTEGRTNISLVNAVFGVDGSTTTASSELKIIYRTRVVSDVELQPYTIFSASSDAWVTVTTSTDSTGIWTPGNHTGDRPQIAIEVLTASASTGGQNFDIYLKEINFTVDDTGGL